MIAQIEKEIRHISKDHFQSSLIEDFISKFQSILNSENPVDYFLQISTDAGIELELGFFTKSRIADVTLSNGKIYSYDFPVSKIHKTAIADSVSKSTLTIFGEKKFDYNIVKPLSKTALEKYENSLRTQIGI